MPVFLSYGNTPGSILTEKVQNLALELNIVAAKPPKAAFMGSERKLKEKKNKRRSYSSDSEDEGRRKRQRTVEDELKKNRKREKKDKQKEKKSHKHSKDKSDKGKKSKDKHKIKRHKDDSQMLEFQELSNDDYFSKNNEFATWLKEEKDVFFSDLSSESARELFSHFVKAWNKKKLESRYYEGIASGPRTAHNWKIK